MNFKKIFFTLLLICSLTSVKPEKEESEREVTAKRLFSFLGLPYKDKNKLLEYATVNDIYFLISWVSEPELSQVSTPELAAQERAKIVERLQYLQQEKPELIQAALDSSTSKGLQLNIERIKALVKFGAKPHENFKDKNYNAIEKLEARLGQRQIDGIKSLNCNPSAWSKFWGQDDQLESVECFVTQKALDILNQAEKKEIAIEKANAIADATEGN